MPTLNIFTALFIMAAVYGTGRGRFHLLIGTAALVAVPAAMGIVDGTHGLIYSLAGASAALFLTAPLCILKLVSWTDVIVSVALGATLGAVQYAAVFIIAALFLSVQRMLRIDGSLTAGSTAAGNIVSASPHGAGLLALDEKSALVEIEAMKILHMDRKDFAKPVCFEQLVNEQPAAADFGTANVFPWCAKLAIATLAVLMIGTAM